MNGMHCETHSFGTWDSDFVTSSHEFELPPTPTIAQLSMCDYAEYDDEGRMWLTFTDIEHLDSHGVTRHQHVADLGGSPPAGVKVVLGNRLVRADFGVGIENLQTNYLVNFFFWDSVS